MKKSTVLGVVVLLILAGWAVWTLSLLAVGGFLILFGAMAGYRLLKGQRWTSKGLLIFTMTFCGLFAYFAFYIVEAYNLPVIEAAAVLTVAAEGLGFIGLSLVEITIFLGHKRQRTQRFPDFPLSMTRMAPKTFTYLKRN